MFTCPKCGQQIDHVIVISECFQDADIDSEGKINPWTYGEQEVTDTTAIVCPACDAEITSSIEE